MRTHAIVPLAKVARGSGTHATVPSASKARKEDPSTTESRDPCMMLSTTTRHRKEYLCELLGGR